jgi:7,8-dihydropterin-6-yl-methyl-4-(beta-D-ribofuranosyl)aminobenzene 5'-phosphate synthase
MGKQQMNKAKITILCDNINGAKSGFKKDPGFAAAIESEGKTILFDTGMQSRNLSGNLKAAGIKPENIDSVILSHNHNDHANGLPAIINNIPDVHVYIHKKWENGILYQGMDIPAKNKITVNNPGKQKNLLSNLLITEPLFSSDYGGITEHAVIILLKNSFILLCGCCHPGLIKFLKQREKLGIDKKMPFHIFGGMHGFSFTDKEYKELNQYILSVTLCHCTEEINTFKKQFTDKCKIGILGEQYSF